VLSVPLEGGRPDQRVPGLLWLTPEARQSGQPQPVVVFCHGNADIADVKTWIVDQYHKLGCCVFVPEYRGYGRAPGQPSETGIVHDTVLLFDELMKRPEIDRSRVAIHGQSLGGGVAAQLAAQR